MKKIYLLLLLIAGIVFLNGCTKEEDSESDSSTEITLPKQAYRLQIVEAKFSQSLPKEEYDGTLGGAPIKLVRTDENTLLFYISGNMELGPTLLTVPDLSVSNTLEVKNPELNGSVETVLKPIFEKTTSEYQQISDVEYSNYLATVNTAFNDYYKTLSSDEKKDMALFYQVNEQYFKEILNPDLQEKGVQETLKIITKFSTATYFFIGGSGLLALPGTPIEKALIGVVAVTGAVKAWDFGKQLINQIAIVTKIDVSFFEDKPANKTFGGTTGLSFVNEEPKNVNLYMQQQNMTTANKSSTASGLTAFFDIYDMLTSATKKTNEVIKFINDHLFFSNIPAITVSNIPTTTQAQTKAITQETFSYLKFSVADSNIKITQLKFENGTINMKMSITNPGAVSGNSINTQLNYSYKEDFNTVSGSIPVEIKLEKDLTELYRASALGSYTVNDFVGNGPNSRLYCELKTGNKAVYTIYDDPSWADGTTFQENWTVHKINNEYFITTSFTNPGHLINEAKQLDYPVSSFVYRHTYVKN